jgi:ABC-type Na+ transport system ATPase subunit NatA
MLKKLKIRFSQVIILPEQGSIWLKREKRKQKSGNNNGKISKHGVFKIEFGNRMTWNIKLNFLSTLYYLSNLDVKSNQHNFNDLNKVCFPISRNQGYSFST